MLLNQQYKEEFFTSSEQFVIYAANNKWKKINDGLYMLCFLREEDIFESFLAKEKMKHKQLQQIQNKLEYSIIYVELFNRDRQVKNTEADSQYEINVIIDTIISKKINLSEWGFRVYDINQLEEEYEFRKNHKEISKNYNFSVDQQSSNTNQFSLNEPMLQINIFSVIHGTIQEVEDTIIIDCRKAHQKMKKEEIEQLLENIQHKTQIQYSYFHESQQFISQILIKCKTPFEIISSLQQLAFSHLKSWVSFPFSSHFRRQSQKINLQAKNDYQDQLDAVSRAQPLDPPNGKARYFDQLYQLLIDKRNDLMSFKNQQPYLFDRIKQVIQCVKNDMLDQDQMRSFIRVLRVLEMKKIKMEAKVNGSQTCLNLFQIVYEGLTELIQQAYRVIKVNPVQKDVNALLNGTQSEQTRGEQLARLEEKYQVQSSVQNLLDRLAISYFKQIASSTKGDSYRIYISFQNGKKTVLTDFLTNLINHTAHPQMWRDTFNKVKLAITYARRSNNRQSVIIQQSYHPQQRLLNIKQNNLGCIGCRTFFTKNESMPQSKEVKVVYLKNIKTIMSEQKEIIDVICGLINQNGGFILFDFEKLLNKIICKGSQLNQRQRIQYIDIIEKIFSKIYPNPVRNIDYWISFVPIHEEMTYKNRVTIKQYEEETKKSQYYVQTNQIEGVFVTRIKISSEKPIKYHQFKMLQSRKNQTIQYKQVNPYLPSPRRFLDHKCSQIPNQEQLNQLQFKNYHILILKQSNLPNLQERIRKLNIKFQFLNRFRDCNFPMMKFVTIMQHSQSHQFIIDHISNITYDGRQVLTIDVRFYIRLILEKNITKKEFQEIEKLFAKEFPNQNITFYIKGEADKCEYYVKSESKLATIFLYALFTSLKFNTIIKDPENIGDLTLLKVIP